MTLAANNLGTTQIAQVEDVLAKGAKVIVVQPVDAWVAASYVQLAHQVGAKIIAYDRAIVSADLDYYVAHDSYRVGVLQAEAAIKATGGKGKYVILAGEFGQSVTQEITRGYENTLAPYVARGDVEIVVKQNHSAWSPEQAQRTVQDAIALTGGKIDAILANNSGMARGAVQAVQAAGLAHVFIAGADADAANINFLCEGKQSVEILKDIPPLATTAAEVAKRLMAGEPPKSEATVELAGSSVPIAAVRVELVTVENVKTLVERGVLTREQLPSCKDKLAVNE